MRQIGTLLVVLVLLNGCTSNVQYSSGKDYLSKYPSQQNIESGTDLDGLVAKAASVEPNLKFPAKIGLVRVHNAQISAIPQNESDAWIELSKKLGDKFGEFIPVSPLIAEMASSAVGFKPAERKNLQDIIAKIRIGAARQHLDVVVIYEVFGTADSESNIFSILDWTIIGGFISPGRDVKAVGYAQALLLDVRNGYPYGTASATATEEAMTAAINSYSKQREMSYIAANVAALKIVPEVDDMFQKLLIELVAKK